MVTSGTVVLFGVLALAQISSSQFLDGDDAYLPEVTSDFLEDLGRYLPCLEGNCDPTIEYFTAEGFPETGTQAEHKTSPYFSLCVDYLNQKEILENKYPHLKTLRSKLLSHFKPALSAYVHEPERRKDIVLEILTEVIHILEKLKSVFEKDWPVKPAPDQTIVVPTEEIIAEEEIHPGFVGSVRGIPGVHYPNYTEVPITSFSCGDVKYIPGFYADLETGCQVFHVCYEHRRESFLCPIGTTFNQPILACDYWYSSNCSLSPHYFDVNAKKEPVEIQEKDHHIEEIITTIIEQENPSLPQIHVKTKETEFVKTELEQILKFLPVKAKVVEFPVKSKVSIPVPVIPKVKPLPVLDPKFKISALPLLKFTKAKAVPLVKAKVVAAAIPVVKAKVAVAAAAVPVKAKVAAAAVPVVKAKIAGVAKAKVAAVPIIKTKVAAIPVIKAKVAAAGVAPLFKAKVAKAKVASAAVPLFKAKTAAKVVPLVKVAAMKPKLAIAKAAAFGVPVIKAKAVMISPLTKKALALGYMKLLKAKKLALLG